MNEALMLLDGLKGVGQFSATLSQLSPPLQELLTPAIELLKDGQLLLPKLGKINDRRQD